MKIGALHLRSIGSADLPTLEQLYAASRSDDPLLDVLPPEQLGLFLQSQCRAQHQHYMQHYAGAEFKLLELDGQLAGRLYWQSSPHALRLIEITLLPPFRGLGWGTMLVKYLQRLAAEQSVPMGLSVACTNGRAKALYQRLGFVLTQSNGVHDEMQCEPAPQAIALETASLTH
jgi:ribosomal protein S18 acetylase RimI-like enzyme